MIVAFQPFPDVDTAATFLLSLSLSRLPSRLLTDRKAADYPLKDLIKKNTAVFTYAHVKNEVYLEDM